MNEMLKLMKELATREIENKILKEALQFYDVHFYERTPTEEDLRLSRKRFKLEYVSKLPRLKSFKDEFTMEDRDLI